MLTAAEGDQVLDKLEGMSAELAPLKAEVVRLQSSND
jgi:hypothetical protein